MISVEEALSQILKAFAPLPGESIALETAAGRVLAIDIIAAIDLPPFANSSMDGYAVRGADVISPGAVLAVIGDIPAGHAPNGSISTGQAMRIMTGAPLPDGADTVIPIEQTDGPDRLNMSAALPESIRILGVVKPGEYVRGVGGDVRRGQVVLRAGRILRAADLGVLAGLGFAQVSVIQRPIVAILSTGDELVTPDQPLAFGQIRDMNGYTLPALIEAAGGHALRLGIAHDTESDVRAKLEKAIAGGAHLIISSAGVSVGAFDVVKTVIDSLGSLDFWKVNMRPGKPLAFGAVHGIPFIGLPGNPVSAMVTFDVFARPAIQTLAGRDWQIAEEEALTAESIQSDGRQSYLRVTLARQHGAWIAHLTGSQESNMITSLVAADGLLIVPAGVTDVPIGTRLKVRRFEM